MGDAKEFIIDFLQRHNFTSAESAFKAELLCRERGDIPVPSSESVLDWELELRLRSLLQGTADHFDMNDKPFPTMVEGTSSTADKVVNMLTQRSRFPAEKQLFVQHEMEECKAKEPVGNISQEFAFEDFRTLPLAETSGPRGLFQVGSEFVKWDRSGNTNESMCWVESLPKTEGPIWGMQDGALLEEKLSTEGPVDQNPTWDVLGTEVQHLNSQASSSTVFPFLMFPAENKVVQTQTDMKMRIFELPMFAETCTAELRTSFQDLTIQECKNEMKGPRFDGVPTKERGLDALQELIETGKGTSLSVSGTNILLENGGFISSSNKRANPDSVLETSLPLLLLDGEQERWIQADWMLNEPVKMDAAGAISLRSQEAREKQGVKSLGGDQELLSRLPPVRLHSLDKNVDLLRVAESAAENSTKSLESAALRSLGNTTDVSFGWATCVDGPLSQDMPASGLKRSVSRPSVSQGIVEDMSERLSGFATVGDGLSEREYPDEYCDSDTYEDDDDPGYLRQPIEDEEWFLAHEIDLPSDSERLRHGDKSVNNAYNKPTKLEEDDRSFVEEESYFSGEEYYRSQELKEDTYRSHQSKPTKQAMNSQIGYSSLYSSLDEIGKLTLLRSDTDSEYKKRILDAKEFDTTRAAPAWEGFISQSEGVGMGDDKLGGPSVDEIYDEPQGSVRSGGNVVSSDAADVGSEVRDSLLGGSSEGDVESVRDQEPVYRSAHGSFYSEQKLLGNEGMTHLDRGGEEERDMVLEYYTEAWGHANNTNEKVMSRKDGLNRGCTNLELGKNKHTIGSNTKGVKENGALTFEGFSFPSPSSAGDIAMPRAESGKSLWSNRDSIGQAEETDGYGSGIVGPDDTLAAWKRKSNESSPIVCLSEENLPNLLSNHSTVSARSTDEFVSVEAREDGIDGPIARQQLAQDDEDAAAAQENIRRLGVDEDEYEIFNLRIIHRKNRTGFEEEKDFPVVLNSVIAGRYHVTEYLGSAAFSKAIQAHDLHTGMDVCMKIIKNNKDFFDQSLDEVKLLKFVNKHDPADKYHILRLYDYFYHREHLFIVCELLRANLYEFHKFNRESGGEVYFTMPRLQSITRQCLEALEYLHKLGIIHCDLKPENILVKSYSRCEIKIIDLGSSCFQTDHLCSYVQSRSYRAPEVILGLSYDQKIDIWSLGCILAELCSGNVLFQNDSLATLLARVVGILGPVDLEILGKGRDTHKYFTKNHMLYERNQETDQLEYLLPKKTSLHHRLPMGDKGFIEFVGCLLQSNPAQRPSATEALQHPWLSYPYEPISS